MSVPKSKRGISDMEFYNNACKIRKMVTDLLLRDFGIKKRKTKLEYAEKVVRISDEDKEILDSLFEKYQFGGSVLYDIFPEWLIENERKIILKSVNRLVENLVRANSYFPTTQEEKTIRKYFQNIALSECFILKNHLQFCVENFPVKANCYMDIVEKIETEIFLIKRWRQHTNKLKV